MKVLAAILVIGFIFTSYPQNFDIKLKKQNLELGGILPADEEVYRYDSEGKPTFQLPLESKAVQSARRIFEKYIQ